MIENNPESAAGSCQETGAGGHAGNSDAPRERVEYGAPGTSARKPGAPIDAEADACDCATCREGLPPPVYRPAPLLIATIAHVHDGILDILADVNRPPASKMFPPGSKLPAGPMPSEYRDPPSPAGMVRGALDALATAAAAKTIVQGRSTLEILYGSPPAE